MSMSGRVYSGSQFKVTVHPGGGSKPKEREESGQREEMNAGAYLSFDQFRTPAHRVVKPKAMMGLPPPSQSV